MLARRATLLVACLVLAVASFAASPQPVGMLSSHGSDTVAVSGVTVPSGTTLYKGDTIETASGYAFFTLTDGAGFVINPNSKVRLTGAQSVELLKGMSRIEARRAELTLVASNWVLAPSLDSRTGRVSADIVVEGSGRVSVNVNEGRMTAKSAGAKEVTVAQLGRPVLLPAAAAPPAPQTPASPPAASASHSNAKTIGAYVLGVSAIAVGVAAIATRDSGVSASQFSATQGQVAALSSQLSQLSTQNTALQAQVTSLSATVTALRASVASSATYGQNVQALLAQLTSILSQLQTAQSQLASNQNQINALVAQVAGGTPLTSAQMAQLQTLQAAQTTLSGQIASLSSQAATAAGNIGRLTPPVSPTSPGAAVR